MLSPETGCIKPLELGRKDQLGIGGWTPCTSKTLTLVAQFGGLIVAKDFILGFYFQNEH